MGTLNPTLLSPELDQAMNAAAARMRATGRLMLTPALLLLTFARDSGSAAASAADRAGPRTQLPHG